jgi:heparanase 1
MRKDARSVLLMALATVVHAGAAFPSRGTAQSLSLAPSEMPRVGTVDERFNSYNVEMAEIIGGTFWKPYKEQDKAARNQTEVTGTLSGAGLGAGQDPAIFEARPPIGLTTPRLAKLTAALGPAHMRVSGTWANTVYFHDADTPAPKPPNGFQGVLTRLQWRGVIDFARAVNAKLMTSFAISTGVRDAAGVWAPDQARKLVAYTNSIGGNIAAAEFFNEPTMPEYGGAPSGYNAIDYARDFAVFRQFVRDAAPEIRIAGPASVGEGVLLPAMQQGSLSVLKTAHILGAYPRPVFDIFSYHFYGASSIRCASMGAATQTTPEAALSEEWLSRADRSYAFYGGLRDRFEPGKPVWITEIADAACGGNPWAATFLDTFRYLDQHGRLARRTVNVVFHNTLASSEYGLPTQNTFAPRPSYWAALLWRRLMGATVLDSRVPLREGLHVYAHCLRDAPGGVALLAINNSRMRPSFVDLPLSAERYTLTSQRLDGPDVKLNGNELKLGPNDELPLIQGDRVRAGVVELASTSMTFLAVADAGNPACR